MLEYVQTDQIHQLPILLIHVAHPTLTAVVGANVHVVELVVISFPHVASAIRDGLAVTILHVASAIRPGLVITLPPVAFAIELVVSPLHVASVIRVQVKHLLKTFDDVALTDAYAYLA
jgi:hypothetical protein